MFACEGVSADTEYVVIVPGIKAYSDLRDETAPMLRRTFPGVIVEVDERVVHSDIPDPKWRGAEIRIYGLEYRTAEHVERVINAEYDVFQRSAWDADPAEPSELRAVTEAEAEKIRNHRTTKRENA
jgi:hypothetical protein